MSRAKRSRSARSLGPVRAAALVVAATTLLLAAAWASWRWQHTSSSQCGREPATDSTPAAANAHTNWERCRAESQADRAVPVALAVFAILVTAGGVAMAFVFRPTTRWVRSNVR